MIKFLTRFLRRPVAAIVAAVNDAPVSGLDYDFLAICPHCPHEDDFGKQVSKNGGETHMCYGCGKEVQHNFTPEQKDDLRRTSRWNWSRFKPTPYSWPTWTEEQKWAWLKTSKVAR